ncbi:MAG: GNAT family N-acetyltransferase [Alistipes sp.]|nr:GNAT family N-acetyltransferase [Alistipes sp.]
MDYIKTNHLNKTVLAQLDRLTEPDYIPFYEENSYSDYPAFHFLIRENRLVSFIGIMPVCENTVELTAYTFPAFRRQGHFTSLLKRVMEELSHFPSLHILSAQELFFPFIKNIFSHREYLMKLTPEDFVSKDSDDDLAISEYTFEDDTETEYIYVLRQNIEKNALGILKITRETGSDTACLHHVKIRKPFRNRGYGSALLSRALEHFLFDKKNCAIVLHVTSTNTAAFRLYRKLGFQIIQSLDYYRAELPDYQ